MRVQGAKQGEEGVDVVGGVGGEDAAVRDVGEDQGGDVEDGGVLDVDEVF